MFHEAELRELVEFDGQGSPVVSLYLKVDPRFRTIDEYKLALRGLFESVEIVTKVGVHGGSVVRRQESENQKAGVRSLEVGITLRVSFPLPRRG